MANVLVKDLMSGMNFMLGLYEKFLNICPEDIWTKQFAGWPVSQQFYHALSATNNILSTIVNKKADNPCPQAGNLNTKDTANQPSMQNARDFLAGIKKLAEEVPNVLQDSDLTKENATLCKGRGQITSQAAALDLITFHLSYHLGCCDAALREAGKEGAF